MLKIEEKNNKKILPNEEKILNNTIKLSNNSKSLIYFLLNQKEIIYIGQSKNGFKRIFEHKKKFDEFTYLEVPESELNKIEFLYIQRFQPCMNVNNGIAEYNNNYRFI